MKKLASALILALTASVSMNSQAEEVNNAWTQCGLGGLLGGGALEKGSSGANTVAVIVNITWDLGTTAVTSMTASPDTCGNVEGEVAAFVGENFDELAKQTAQGEGEHLSSLMGVAGCDQFGASAALVSLRDNMAVKVSSESYAQMSQGDKAAQYYQAVMASTGQCQA